MKQIYKELMAVFLNWGSLRMGNGDHFAMMHEAVVETQFKAYVFLIASFYVI